MKNTELGRILKASTNEHLLHLNEGLITLRKRMTKERRVRIAYVQELLNDRGVAFETTFNK